MFGSAQLVRAWIETPGSDLEAESREAQSREALEAESREAQSREAEAGRLTALPLPACDSCTLVLMSPGETHLVYARLGEAA